MDFKLGNVLLVALCGFFVKQSQAIPGPIDLGQALSDRTKYPQVTGFFRIEANIIKMLNPRGTTWNYLPCDLIPGRCDPTISVAID